MARPTEEREIAIELYDSMSNHLAAIKMGVEAKLQEMGEATSSWSIFLEDILASVREALEDLHKARNKLGITGNNFTGSLE